MEGRLLHSLAKDVGATRHQKKPTIHPFDPAALRASIDSAAVEVGRNYVGIRRQASTGSRRSELRQSMNFRGPESGPREFSQRELDMAVDIAVENKESLSTIAGLIKLGANSDLRVTLLQAVAQRDIRLVKLLLAQQGQYGQDAAVDAALSNLLAQLTATDTLDEECEGVVGMLLSADGHTPQVYFDKAVSQQQTCLVELLLRARKPVAPQVISRNLWSAAREANYNLTSMLLAYGADVNATTALIEAIKAKRLKLAVALVVNAQQRLPPQTLTNALKTALGHVRPVEDIYWLKLFLYAGADATIPEVALRLQQAVAARDLQTISLLVNYRAPIAVDGHNALKAAIQAKDCGMIQLLLQSPSRTPTMLGNLIPNVMQSFPTDGRLEPTRLLVDAGAAGTGMSEGLVVLTNSMMNKYGDDTPDALDMTMMEILITNNASVDWKGGAALACAFLAGNRDVFNRINSLKPSDTTRSSVVAACYETSHDPLSPTQTEMALVLIRDGVDLDVLNATLRGAVEYDSTNSQFISALVDYGANASHRDSTIAKMALEKCTPAAFAAIVRGLDVRSGAMRHLIPASMADPEKAKLVLARGCRQEDLDSALADEVRRENIRHEAFDLLLSAGATLDHSQGDLLTSMCEIGDTVALERVLRCKPPRQKVGSALRQTILTRPPGRSQIIELLLSHGVEETIINECLALAVCEPSTLDNKSENFRDSIASLEKDDRLPTIQLLLRYGADVNYGNGAVLKLAVVDSNLSLISVLIKANVAEDILWLVFSHAGCVIDDHDTRYTLFQILLSATKTRPPALHDSLVDLGVQRSQCLHLWNLLLEHGASVNYQNGEALMQTIRQQNLAFVPLLLEQNPSPEVIERALSTALELTPGLRQAVIQKLLDRGVATPALDMILHRAVEKQDEPITRLVLAHHPSASGAVLGKALISAMDHSPNLRWSLVETLFESCAKQPDNLGDALCHAVVKQDVELIRFALGYKPSTVALNRALVPATKYAPDLRLATMRMLFEAGAGGDAADEVINQAVVEHDKNLVRLVLKYRTALGPKASEAISTAAVRGDVPILTGLLAQADHRPSMSTALDAMTDAKTVFEAKSGFACANMLLKKGVNQASLDKALAAVVDDTINGLAGGWYIDNLIKNEADVNAFDGQCVRKAAEHGDWQLFDQLVSAGATAKTISYAVCPLLSSGMEETKLIELLEKCFAEVKPGTAGKRDRYTAEESATFLALKHYPQSRTLLKCLLQHGCQLNWRKAMIVDPAVGEEELDPLMWIFADEETRLKISNEVLDELVASEVDVHAFAPKSKMTPLMLAARNDSRELLDSLLARGVNINAEDYAGRTALLWASSVGCLNIVEKLCAANARLDDGSIHEAARQMHLEIVEILLRNGHHPDYPSDAHEGRSAILEVLLKTDLKSMTDRSRLVQTLKVLQTAKGDPFIDFQGKTAVYCAMANKRPVEALSALLSTDEWQRLNDDQNLFTDNFGRKYSPTMYIEQGLWEGQAQNREPLLKVLRNKRCKDRYFATKGDQPSDAIGVPEDLAREDRTRKALRDQHRLQLKLAQSAHSKQLELQNERHETTMQQERERENYQAKSSKSKFSQVTRQEQLLAAQRQTHAQAEHEIILGHHKQITETLQTQRALAQDHPRLAAPLPPLPPTGPLSRGNSLRDRDPTQERIKAQRALLKEQEEAAKRQSVRRMEELERQNESIKLRNRLVMAQIDAKAKAQAAVARQYSRRESADSGGVLVSPVKGPETKAPPPATGDGSIFRRPSWDRQSLGYKGRGGLFGGEGKGLNLNLKQVFMEKAGG